MKELSIEEKAKRYDEAIEIAREINNEQRAQPFDVMTRVFPELKESKENDDEKVRNEIIAFVEQAIHRGGGTPIPQEQENSWIAWLEAQGEQKPVIEMKSPEESLGVDSDTYNKIVDECIYGEQKPAWSDEDEKQARQIERIIHDDGCTQKLQKQIADWFKSLKERVQPKQEWSEEDRKIIIELIGIFESAVDGGHVSFPYRLIKDYIRVLKSCLPQSHWKPSDEQMEALEHFVRSIGESGYASPYDNDTKLLYSLLFDLKKLREK